MNKNKLFDLSIKAFDNNTQKGIEDYTLLLERFKNMEKEYVQKHFERLKQGKCSMELGSFFTSAFAHFNSISSHLENIIGSFQAEQEIIKNNTFDNKKGYILVVNQNKTKFDDLSTARKNLSGDNSLSDNFDKINKSFG